MTASELGDGIVTIASSHSVDETVKRLEDLLQTTGIRLFAIIDHSGEAERAGMRMNATKLVIFGNPKAGTPVMLAAVGIAIDLPLKILVWQDANGSVWLSWNAPAYLQARHGVPDELAQNIAAAEPLARSAAL
jgi:uncharacterized protein (DUF302 family)